MSKDLHFLINISCDTESLYGVRFFHSFFKNSTPSDITLFHICQLNSSDRVTPLLEKWQSPEERVLTKMRLGARRAMEKAKTTFTNEHQHIYKLKTKTIEETYGKVNDILIEGEQGLYDAMILGRRATYALQWIFDRPADEIPLAITQAGSLHCPLWICSQPEENRKNVLLCVDGSKSSLRAADHVGYILKYAPHHSVTLFHVATSRSDNTLEILEEAENVLLNHGIEKNRIHSKRGWGLSIPGAILGEKNLGNYAAVAIGLYGVNSAGFFQRIGLSGGITATLIKKISKAALWCCP